MNIDDFRGEKPALDLFDYFECHSTAWGWFEDRFGTIKRQFRIEITGTITAGELRLGEEFFYRDGARARRVWHINRTGEAGYCGRADDVVGVARGRAEGPALNWRYRLALPVGKRSYHLETIA